MCQNQNCLKCHFLNQQQIPAKDGDLKICPPVAQTDYKLERIWMYMDEYGEGEK